jgi:DNA-binding NarL/FixJ family response regulator
MAITVVVADDQPLVRAGIAMLLAADPGIAVVGEAADGRQAVDLAQRLTPDVVLMDLQMPGTDGAEATRALTRDAPAHRGAPDHLTRVLVLTTFGDEGSVHAALRAGASGFLLKHAVPQDLISALYRVAGGDAWLDPAVAGTVIDALAAGPARDRRTEIERVSSLTPRETEVLLLMADGLSNREIAARLCLSGATVKTHAARVTMKTGSRDRAQAVALAYQSGLARA